MRTVGLVTKIGPIGDGEQPQTKPYQSTPLRIEVDTTTEAVILEMTRDAATELVDRLGSYLKSHWRGY